MEDTKGAGDLAQRDELVKNIDLSEDQTIKQQNNENEIDGAVVYHSLMNAAPETQGETLVREGKVEIEEEPKLVTETVSTLNFDSETKKQGQHGTNHSEESQQPAEELNQPENNAVNTNISTDLPNISAQQTDEDAFRSSSLSQSSVDAQMEKVIDDIVELGGCQQFVQTLGQHDSIIDKEREVEHIQREIIGDGNLAGEVSKPIEAHRPNEREQHSKIEAEKSVGIGDLTQISDLSSLQEANLEENKEEIMEENTKGKGEEENKDDHREDNIEVQKKQPEALQREPQLLPQQQEPQQPQLHSPRAEAQEEANEGQQLHENPPIVEPNEQKKSKSLEEDETPQEGTNDTANTTVDSNVADTTEEELQGHGDEAKVITVETESSEQIEKPEKRQRRGSSRKVASTTDQSVEVKSHEEVPQEVETKRRSSKRIKFSSKLKDEEAEEPTKPTRRKKEDTTEDKDTSMDEEPENEPKEVKHDDDPKEEVEKPTKVVRGARNSRKSMPAELPKVKLERKPTKRSLEKDDSHDKSLQPVIKTPSRAVASARSVTAPSSTTKTDYKLQMSSDYDESKKYQCEHCAYSTDRLNNIVYHKKSSCSYAQKHFAESVEKWKQTLQSPKSNSKRSSR